MKCEECKHSDKTERICYYMGENRCVDNEDAINRQAVLEIINDIRDCISVEGYWAIFERMKKLPPANSQEPKTGHWIFHTDASGNSWHTCPACGHVAYTLTRFCPDCGARLEALA